jgi:phosphoribosylformylglycinamidine synthase
VTAVQIGDPITQKKFSDVIVKEARDPGLYTSITDNGAGGLSCSVAEMAKECGGCMVHLDRVPLKYPGMAPWEIWISESQERMTLAVPPENLDAFMALMRRRDVEATVIGEFTDSGGAWSVSTVSSSRTGSRILHERSPKKQLKTCSRRPRFRKLTSPARRNLGGTLPRCSGERTSARRSTSPHIRHTVQGAMSSGRCRGRDACRGWLPHESGPGSEKGVGLSRGYSRPTRDRPVQNGRSGIEPHPGLVATRGNARPGSRVLDNFCWCSSDEPGRLWQLKRAAKGCYDCATAIGTPFTSGKDSMFKDFSGSTRTAAR